MGEGRRTLCETRQTSMAWALRGRGGMAGYDANLAPVGSSTWRHSRDEAAAG